MNTPKCYSIWVNVGYEERENITMHLLEEEQITSLLDIVTVLTSSKSVYVDSKTAVKVSGTSFNGFVLA